MGTLSAGLPRIYAHGKKNLGLVRLQKREMNVVLLRTCWPTENEAQLLNYCPSGKPETISLMNEVARGWLGEVLLMSTLAGH